ncbi:hypothetical protein SCOR_04065 [Sulfidibacter corallicola]|uniref:Protein-tyrosine-phosphatase n=2 Tax=Sulfidibacter corallicola TaxID=2818388 RepID=A0A8A4TPZ3_SULCO|nr:hypothetical protein [Sulfidibacter corallicola]QTD52046.1 hypothetical protein J3U87_06195 [Sulfidibacter corallicola]
MYRNHPALEVRSAGTSPNARRTVNAGDLRWADIVMVMEYTHKNRLKAQFGRLLEYKKVVVLDIPDDYHYMDPELIGLIEDSVSRHLEIPDQDV